VPWEVIASRVERFLRLRYVAATVAGLVLVTELTFLALPGTPAHRRGLIVEAAKRVAGTRPSTLTVLLFVALVLLTSYLIGSLARSITNVCGKPEQISLPSCISLWPLR
jgi:hypothetical protein